MIKGSLEWDIFCIRKWLEIIGDDGSTGHIRAGVFDALDRVAAALEKNQKKDPRDGASIAFSGGEDD